MWADCSFADVDQARALRAWVELLPSVVATRVRVSAFRARRSLGTCERDQLRENGGYSNPIFSTNFCQSIFWKYFLYVSP